MTEPFKRTLYTIADLLNKMEKEEDNFNCFNHLKGGAWEAISTKNALLEIKHLTLGLLCLGLKPGDTVGILAQPSPHWVMMDCAISLAGAVSVPLFPNLSARHFLHEIQDSNTRFLFVGDKTCWQRAAPHAEAFRRVITMEFLEGRSNTLYYHDVIDRGEALSIQAPNLYNELKERIKPDNLWTIIYTSGTSGLPKGVRLTHGNVTSQLEATIARFPFCPGKETYLNVLPLGHVMGRTIIFMMLAINVKIYFADDVKNTGKALQACHAHNHFCGPSSPRKGLLSHASAHHGIQSPHPNHGKLGFSIGKKYRPGFQGLPPVYR